MGAGSSTEAEREPLLVPSYVETNTNPVNSRVYGRRWLVLTLFSLLALMQGMVWNFWGPIQNSAAHAYGFTKSDIAILVLWGPAGFLPWLLFMWLMDKKGLRASLLLSTLFMVLGAALRSIPLTGQPLRRWLIHGGQLLNGLAGPTMMSAGPYLSTTWFAPDQRATATAVASLFSYLGGAASFIVGPLIVPAPNDTQALTTISAAVSDIFIRDRIQLVMYAELAAIAVLFGAVLLYFPARPPMPPSVAAASQRLSYRSSICRLLSNLRFLMIALAYAVPTGVIAGWSGVLDMVLTPAKVSQVDAGWIGFWSTVGGCVFGVAMARFADSIRGMLKLILVLMLAGASLASTWFTLTCLSSYTHLPSTSAILYTSCILVGIFINSSVPIFFELFIETVYPVPEGITCGVVTFLGNLVTGLLLFFLTFYCKDVSWLNWCLTGSCLFSLVLILFFRESYDRLYLDVFVSV
ncbi:solute carrier family 49 member 4 [Maylandia zebra]|uniref:Disrupted in renal carcinoma protein 2 n=3 Tax=Haplochromini TaxID=319058 RepID=A0A3B4G3F6_9CICH|nr:disrupted in renal carcinoma protein 2 [Maylandia zebra]XP_005746273.1 PREDICTED: disrupted in renal carcinoma protein 2 [Pundamilia nyererei]XP_025999736.1 disrupted in renal carcinoma protein 2 [Astatotilapia calliptera]XP_039890731.1 solute carrier family 49 member 4 [Simochromis diagramma]